MPTQNLKSYEGFRAAHTCRSFQLKAQRAAQVSPSRQTCATRDRSLNSLYCHLGMMGSTLLLSRLSVPCETTIDESTCSEQDPVLDSCRPLLAERH